MHEKHQNLLKEYKCCAKQTTLQLFELGLMHQKQPHKHRLSTYSHNMTVSRGTTTSSKQTGRCARETNTQINLTRTCAREMKHTHTHTNRLRTVGQLAQTQLTTHKTAAAEPTRPMYIIGVLHNTYKHKLKVSEAVASKRTHLFKQYDPRANTKTPTQIKQIEYIAIETKQ